MKLFKNLSRLQIGIFALLVCISGVLGYLFYDTYRTNIQNRNLIAESKIDNKDLSQDLEIVKNKYDNLKTDLDVLKNKVRKVSYKRKVSKKRHIYSAGRSSKYKKHYRKNLDYKKLYLQLRNKCYGHKSGSKISNKHTKKYNPGYVTKYIPREYHRK